MINCNRDKVAKGRKIVVKIVAVAVWLVIITVCPAFGQMYGSSSYSDSWTTEQGIWGCGVTEDYYNNYNHTYTVYTEMTSPQGRYVSFTGGPSAPYSRADVFLDFDLNDTETYMISSNHEQYCPVSGDTFMIASTAASIDISLSQSAYFKQDPSTCRWVTWGINCPGTCSQDHNTNGCAGPNLYKECVDIVVNGNCFVYRLSCLGRPSPGTCSRAN